MLWRRQKEAVEAKPTQANQRALKRAERQFAKAFESAMLANRQVADIDTEVIPEGTVEAQRRAEQAMPATDAARPAMAAAAPTTVEEVTAKEPTIEEARTIEQQAADKQSLLAERRKARDELMAADPDLSKAEAMRMASEAGSLRALQENILRHWMLHYQTLPLKQCSTMNYVVPC